MAKHTPTPWNTSPGILGTIYALCVPIAHTCSGEGYDWVPGTRFLTSDIADANAKFIVRACNSHYELLAALKSLTATVEQLAAVKREGITGEAYEVMTATIGDDITEEFVAAERAIAKAEGK
jgi:hypothetical protein